ncbi:WbqC family protein [Salinimicrobium terrae]|uniref:WbqC family protein n=1 Tax=Salinimicrobium terrae TaxID=470866 RepID=UPI000421E0CC|nr:WbqC family protein [Salinimicrobium terrae]
MQKLLLHPVYFGPVSQFAALANAEEIVFENEDNYQKQTYRNRMYIYGANGKLLLNIPIKHTGNKSGHQKYKDIKIENDFPWQKQHWKSIETVYRTSPFFEFYEDDFYPLYHQKFKFLMDFNYHSLELALECMQTEINFKKTTEYLKEPKEILDGRFLAEAKNKKSQTMETYPQVFQEKFGFLNDLSIVDLIFNEGPNALNYLQRQKISFP